MLVLACFGCGSSRDPHAERTHSDVGVKIRPHLASSTRQSGAPKWQRRDIPCQSRSEAPPRRHVAVCDAERALCYPPVHDMQCRYCGRAYLARACCCHAHVTRCEESARREWRGWTQDKCTIEGLAWRAHSLASSPTGPLQEATPTHPCRPQLGRVSHAVHSSFGPPTVPRNVVMVCAPHGPCVAVVVNCCVVV